MSTERLFHVKDAPSPMRDDGAPDDASAAWASTVRVSGEPVRSNAVPTLQGWAADLVERLEDGELAGAVVAMRQMEHIVVTSQGADLGRLEIEHFVQVVEYDPVRHMAMVIGTRDAPNTIPLVWLMLRVYPGSAGVAVLPSLERGEVAFLRSAVRGSFEEAFAVGEQMAGKGREGILGPAARSFERVGTVLVVPPGGEPADVLELLGR
jgi:hypothetical protein